MTNMPVPHLSSQELIQLAKQHQRQPNCTRCAKLICPGWESLSATFDSGSLKRIGTLRIDGEEDPSFSEHHPDATHSWSPDAPISTRHFPYNRCDVWACVSCFRPFLRYTEYGGYYEEERIRELNAELVNLES